MIENTLQKRRSETAPQPEVGVVTDKPLARIAASLYDPADPDNRINFRPMRVVGERGLPSIDGVWGVVRLNQPDGTISHVGLPIRKLPDLGRRITEYLGNDGKIPHFELRTGHDERWQSRPLRVRMANTDQLLHEMGANNHAPIEVSPFFDIDESDPIAEEHVTNLTDLEPDRTRSGLRVFKHDSSEAHFANDLLRPEPMQLQLRECSLIDLGHRQDHGQNTLKLPGEYGGYRFPYAYSGSIDESSGIYLIDTITDDVYYLKMLQELADLPSAADVDTIISNTIGYAEATGWDRNFDNMPVSQIRSVNLAINRLDIPRNIFKRILSGAGQMLTLTNFNLRHYEGRNLTADEANQAAVNYVEGLRDIAHKIRGDEELPQAA